MENPFGSVSQFHAQILAHLPADAEPRGIRAVSDEHVAADSAALHEDYCLIGDLLDGSGDRRSLRYAVDFTANLARSIDDAELLAAATALQDRPIDREPGLSGRATLAGLVQSRLTGCAGLAREA